jgi:hypothetical protein
MQAVAVDQAVQTVALKEVQRRVDADRVRLDAAEPGLGARGVGKACGYDRRAPVKGRVVAKVLQRGERLKVAKISAGDPLSFGVIREILLVQDASLRREGEIGVEAAPVDLVA